jgi:hypothetical protein
LVLPHGEVETPVFMPVGTQGAVKTLHPDDLRSLGARIILGNTYHLFLRPGLDVLRELRGLRLVLDAREIGPGKYALELPDGSATDLIAEGVAKPLNAKLGKACFASAGAAGTDIDVSFAADCAVEAVRSRFETAPPAGLLSAPEGRSRSVRKIA